MRQFLKNNIANALTAMRLVIAIYILILYFSNAKNWLWRCAGLFVFALLTDVVDGFVARKFHSVSNVGKLLDPICDKSLMFAMLLVLTLSEKVDLWVLIAYGIKEVLMLIGGLIFLCKKIVVFSNWIGKAATVLFAIAIGLSVLDVSFSNYVMIAAVAWAIFALIQYGLKFVKELRIRKSVDEVHNTLS